MIGVDLAQIRHFYDYNRWANGRLLGAAAALAPELLTRDLGSSYGSVWITLRHILWGEWLWLGRWQARTPAGLDPQTLHDFPALRSRWTEIEQEQLALLDGLTAADLARLLSYDNPPGTSWTYTLGEMIYHVLNHSTYHRGQVAGMLRQLDVTPPTTDYLVYLDERSSTA